MAKILLVIIFLTTTSISSANEPELNTLWKLKVTNSGSEKSYVPSKSRTHIPATTCNQEPISRSKNESGQVQEFIQINCVTGINGRNTLTQTCYVNKHDSSWAAITVDDNISKFTIELSCLTF